MVWQEEHGMATPETSPYASARLDRYIDRLESHTWLRLIADDCSPGVRTLFRDA